MAVSYFRVTGDWQYLASQCGNVEGQQKASAFSASRDARYFFEQVAGYSTESQVHNGSSLDSFYVIFFISLLRNPLTCGAFSGYSRQFPAYGTRRITAAIYRLGCASTDTHRVIPHSQSYGSAWQNQLGRPHRS